jgi:DNA polymerase V
MNCQNCNSGARIVEELRGIPCLPLEHCPAQKKSVSCSCSFGAPVESFDELRARSPCI